MKTVGLFAYGETGYSALKSLLSAYTVLWVITPPREETEEEDLSVEQLARENNIPIHRIDSQQQILALITTTTPDVVVISTFNKVLSPEILSKTKFINIHHGDLPNWRGRANINWAIILDKKEIGLTFHEATEDLDAGNIYDQCSVVIDNNDMVKTVYDKFNKIIEEKTADIVKKVLEGDAGRSQVGDPTYCCTRLPEDGFIDWNKTTREIYNLVRALTKPYPGAFTFYKGEKMHIWETEIPMNPRKYEGRIPGRIVEIHKGRGVEVLTQDSSIIIKSVTYNNENLQADSIIKSIKNSLGLTMVDLYEQLRKINEH